MQGSISYYNGILQEIIQGEEGGNKMNLKDRAKKLKMDIPAIFLALKDKDTPLPAKIFGGITIVYALSPILGYLDDVILLPLLIGLTIKFIPEDVIERNRLKAEGMWVNGKPKKWYYAIPVILFWIIIILLFIKILLS